METILQTTESANTTQEQIDLDKMSNLVMSDAGTILDGKYEIKREIARGGMGIVYEAYHQYTHQRVAIKVILADRVDPIQLKRFQKEIEAYSLLSHPNVITIHDAGVYKNYPYIVMEYIEGVDICTYVKQQEKNRQEDEKSDESKGRDWKLCARLIYETALGLEYIHSKKMIHRDIKPANILVRPNGSPVIIDLGIVKFNKTQSYNLTRSKETIGTFEYMPIEQAKGKTGKIDARTDVYSLGLVLYELLTGQRAYSGENVMELCYKIMSYYPPLPRKIDAQIPEVLEEITIHAIEKQREKRYASMKEFADALKQYLDAPTVNKTPQEVLEKGKIPASMIVFEDDLKQYLDTPITESTPQYGQINQKLNMQRNKNKVVRYCKVALLVIGFVTILDIIVAILYSSKIRQDDAESQYNQGLTYYKEGDYEKAVEWYEKSANQGHTLAQNNLGAMYYKGDGVKQDYAKALYWFEKSANQEDAKAQGNLGAMYYKGDGVKQDYTKALYWFEKSAEQGYATAQNNLGFMYYKGDGVKQDYAKALYWYEKSANQGNKIAKQALQELKKLMQKNNIQDDAESQYKQGLTYYAKEDYEKAVEWYEKSAMQGHAQAQYNLGHMYYYGVRIEKNLKKAFYWNKKSAEQGNAEAQFRLGNMYKSGDGAEQNLEEALYWYEKSANQGNKIAKQALQELKKLMQETNTQDDAESQYNQGLTYYKEREYPKAHECWKKSANQGFAGGQCGLGVLYCEGKGVKQDYNKALYWFEKSANQGFAKAQHNLGYMYYNGQGVKQDYAKALYWYEKSANQGLAEAQLNLGYMYYKGNGVKQDYAKALYWYEKSANQGFAKAKQALQLLKILMQKE